MVSIPKVVGVMSCGFLLCLGLSTAAQAGNTASAADEMKADQSNRRQGGQEIQEKKDPMKGAQSKGGRTIQGEVLRVEGDNYFVRQGDGKEVRLQTDTNTQILRTIHRGDQIEAKVTDQNHTETLVLLDQKNNDGYGNDIRRTPDAPLESGKSRSMGQ